MQVGLGHLAMAIATGVEFTPRFRDQMGRNEIFVQRHAQTWAIRNGNPTIDGLNPLVGQFMPQRRIFHAVLEQERVAAGAQPVQTGRRGDRARVAMIAQPRADLLHALLM